jgi:hypothetical protein
MKKNIVIDPNFDSYQSFFDHAWAQSIDKVGPQGRGEGRAER